MTRESELSSSPEAHEDEMVDELIREERLEQKQDEEKYKEFDNLDYTFKLERLQKLVQQSQVFSKIIGDTLLESVLEKKQQQGERSDEVKTNDKINKVRESISMAQPALVTGAQMREYQLEGTQWLITLYENGLNGILADEMGLGKTLQCIGLLAFLYEKGIRGPFLITAPLSVVGNWVSELKRFAPSLPVLGYIGLKDDRKALRDEHYSSQNGFNEAIVVTSYETVLRDFEFFNKVDWKFLIVDEGHRLKNINCKLIRELKRLKTQNRLLLTGTPLQNNLNELWSLLNFILPDIFQDLELFQRWFDFSSITELKKDTDDSTKKMIDTKIQETLVQNLHSILKPFLLRRLKKSTLQDLVPKKEFIIYGKLSPDQDKIYKAALMKRLRNEVLKFALRQRVQAEQLAIDQVTVEAFIKEEMDGHGQALYDVLHGCVKWVDQKKMNNLMMQLRLICDSPYLFYYPWDDEKHMTLDALLKSSSKLQLLQQLLPRLIEQDHKVLIFCQFTTMIPFVLDFCDLNGFGHCYLEGSMDQLEREQNIKSFTEDPQKQVFILSTRAGGLGLNLVAADSVILLDSDWNPQVDLQAMDRVHRIGQTNPVAVYRFITANTVEEVILAKADSKRKLEKLVISMGKFENLQRLMRQDNSLLGTTEKKREQSDLAAELKSLYEEHKLTGVSASVKDNTLTQEELAVLLDRSDESYSKTPDSYKKFEHVQLFETTSSLE
ncbi:putative ATPase CYBJADRAFT_153887 [Cyberlindnera jadinii NRRL Y-1542]|uniref:Uncharacterized protein n=1 Tax=Cyberlindnera jadinii (strain ATCC 18201 / CBS 1600 / BCRC 20928 / JCM 3617 / NBRC 0987 / NRRL Y-1542) TaxID=983966 RepID=A0A1E4RX60_CYBJN|nr:hypothetical protein CYBJADRAFT_153887 [Cyberlindnera jadinii NRRL Y-1542]ODV71867.1 hypothetical protein CYBJADRAFT_153887 [Cyberlindnera jadinii NRRL Y-1542]